MATSTITSNTPALPPVPLPAQSSFLGTIVNALTGYPVAGANVQLVFVEPQLTVAGSPTYTPLGQGTSDQNGAFSIQLLQTTLVQERLCLLQYFAGASIGWQVTLDGQSVSTNIVTRKAGAVTEVTFTANVPPVALTVDQWAAAAARLTQAKIVQFHSIVSELVLAPVSHSLFADWPAAERHAAVQSLEQEFLDPTGTLRKLGPVPTFYQLKTSTSLDVYQTTLGTNLTAAATQSAFNDYSARLTGFSSPSAIDWVIDLKALSTGQVSAAVNANEHAYRHVSTIGQMPGLPPSLLDAVDYLVNYRDYLRAIFAGAPVEISGTAPNDYDSYLKSLTNRFHQDFTTTDSNSVPANQLLIPIVTSILTASTGVTYGFGIAASAIPAQGATQSNSAYVAQLLALSGVSTQEFSLRYRMDATRSDAETSSPVQLNIDTLQGFYSDGFQSSADPSPIFPKTLLGRAPFYLEYEEWLTRNGPFYGENYYQITDTVYAQLSDEDVAYFSAAKSNAAADGYSKWLGRFIDLETALSNGQTQLGLGEYTQATNFYLQASQIAETALQTAIVDIGGIPWTAETEGAVTSSDVLSAVSGRLAKYRSLPMKQPSDLDSATGSVTGVDDNFMDFLRLEFFNHVVPLGGNAYGPPSEMTQELTDDHPKILFSFLHAYLYAIPVCLGDVAMASYDYPAAEYYYGLASGFAVGRAKVSDPSGYSYWYQGTEYYTNILTAAPSTNLTIESDGTLPYSCDVSAAPAYSYLVDVNYPSQFFVDLASAIVISKTHSMEQSFLRLRQGEAILEWADSLYRTDDVANLARARELYKAAIWIHGVAPPISPDWTAIAGFYFNQAVNPALTSQLTRAQKAFYQLAAGLNYLGYSSGYVPPLRYIPLKAAADQFATAAKSAETDYLNAISQVENDIQQALLTSNMLQKAAIQAEIAGNQVDAASIAVSQAQNQVTMVQQAIVAANAAAADADTFGTELGNFFKGAVSAVTSIPSGILGGVGGAAFGAGSSAVVAGAAAGGIAGIALYAVTSGIIAAGNAASQYEATAQTLQDQTLPQAAQVLQTQQDQLNIANLQGQAAQADAALAQALINFQANRTLTTEFWGKLVQVFKRALRRYLDLGTQYAWLAQQALAYEQARAVDVIRLDYFASDMLGVSGADMLQVDLAELEGMRLAGFKSAVPVKHTVSLFSDFPLQYGDLKQTGSCTFRTLEQYLSNAYPGFYGFRVRAVDVAVINVSPGPLRGVLGNYGASWLSQADGTSTMSVRFPDARPLSEFSLRKDMAVFGMPDDSLMTFEGSGYESFWSLQFPATANQFGLDSLMDVQLTFDLTAYYSASLFAQQMNSQPTTVERFLMIPARGQNQAQITAFNGTAQAAVLKFDLTQLKLPKQESNRMIANLAVVAVNGTPLNFSATLSSGSPVASATVAIAENLAISNAPPIVQTGSPASPLNVFIGQTMGQVLTLTISKASNAGVDFSQLFDVILAVDYKATLN